MSETLNYTREQLEALADVLNKELAVLFDEKKMLDDAIERINRNMQVVGALLDLKQIHEQREAKVEDKPKTN